MDAEEITRALSLAVVEIVTLHKDLAVWRSRADRAAEMAGESADEARSFRDEIRDLRRELEIAKRPDPKSPESGSGS